MDSSRNVDSLKIQWDENFVSNDQLTFSARHYFTRPRWTTKFLSQDAKYKLTWHKQMYVPSCIVDNFMYMVMFVSV